jgi:hypothetical protein
MIVATGCSGGVLVLVGPGARQYHSSKINFKWSGGGEAISWRQDAQVTAAAGEQEEHEREEHEQEEEQEEEEQKQEEEHEEEQKPWRQRQRQRRRRRACC